MTVREYGSAILGDVDDSYYFGISCSTCYCIRRLSLVRLRDLLGWYFKVSDLRKKLNCVQCGSGHLLVTFLTPAQNEQGTKRLFDRKAVCPAEL